jgi:hypothetical protein
MLTKSWNITSLHISFQKTIIENRLTSYVAERLILAKLGSPAPFTKNDGHPYLECHHIRKISDAGPDPSSPSLL